MSLAIPVTPVQPGDVGTLGDIQADSAQRVYGCERRSTQGTQRRIPHLWALKGYNRCDCIGFDCTI